MYVHSYISMWYALVSISFTRQQQFDKCTDLIIILLIVYINSSMITFIFHCDVHVHVWNVHISYRKCPYPHNMHMVITITSNCMGVQLLILLIDRKHNHILIIVKI